MLTTLAASALLNALLLFLVQPMFGKMVLPVLGGTPAVWTACMLFFQIALLAGYAYAHLGPRLLGLKRHALLHAGVIWLPLFALPIVLRLWSAPTGNEGAGFVLATTALSVGAPFVLLSAAAPLLQAWAAGAGIANPYALYAMSNAGSFAALLLYPTLIEPQLTLSQQARLWSIGYVAVALATTWNAVAAARGASATEAADSSPLQPSLGMWRRLRWVALAAAPSSLLLGTTTSLTLNVAPIPMLWIAPLAIYLASFVVVFNEKWRVATLPDLRRLLPLVLLPEIVILVANVSVPLAFQVTLHLAMLALLATLCHGMLAADRPPASRLTEFYFWMSLGGALGGIFNSLLAPRLFLDVTEFPFAVMCCVALLATGAEIRELVRRPHGLLRPAAAALVVAIGFQAASTWHWPPAATTPLLIAAAVLCLSVSRAPAQFAASIVLVMLAGALTAPNFYGAQFDRARTFFGTYRVVRDGSAGEFNTLYHGTTMHGRQRSGETPAEPLAYYSRTGPIGELFGERGGRIDRVGVIGLGVGALAAYAQPHQQWTFYEIDPEVERIARDSRWFSFLTTCGAACRVVAGDGRITLARSDEQYDVLVLDAFSSDAVPVHLLTTEAATLYLSHLSEHGVIALHISNKFLDLPSVVRTLATHLNLAAAGRIDMVPPDDRSGRSSSIWVMLARDRGDLELLAARDGWQWLNEDHGTPWTDDFSSLWRIVRWGG